MDEQNNTKTQKDPLIGELLFGKYLIVKKLGQGSFGSIYSAKENNNWYAIKFENKNNGQALLENEANIMKYLNSPKVPSLKSFGYSGDYNVLVMELMGKSLEDIFESLPTKKMSIRCVCNLGYQMVDMLEFIHSRHIIHRDIKPDNFIMGRGSKSKYLYMIDFGLSKKYRSPTTLKHYPLIQKKKLTGTARYASVNALKGMTQSRRDDLEAVGYVLMYFLIGRLPWQGQVNKNKSQRYLRIMEIKRDTTPQELCRGFPQEFEEYVSYTRNLEYEEDPNYNMLKELFLKVLKNDGHILDYYYDWDNDGSSLTTDDTNQNFVCKNELNKDIGKNQNDENKNHYIEYEHNKIPEENENEPEKGHESHINNNIKNIEKKSQKEEEENKNEDKDNNEDNPDIFYNLSGIIYGKEQNKYSVKRKKPISCGFRKNGDNSCCIIV